MLTQAKKALAAAIALIGFFLLAPQALAQLVPAQNQQILAPYGGFVVATSSSGTSKLSATTTPYFANFFFGSATGTNLALGILNCNTTSALTTNSLGSIVCGSISGGGSGTVTNIATTYPVQGGPITTTGTLSLAFGTTTPNIWGPLQTFGNASSTLFSSSYASSTNQFAGLLTLPNLGTAAGSILAVNAAGQVIATTTPTGTNYWTKLGNAISNNTGQSVGVNITTPSAALEVEATSSAPAFIAWSSGLANLFNIQNNGNVGIGTSTPYSHLSVWGANTTSGVRAFEVTNSASSTALSVDNAGLTTIQQSSTTLATLNSAWTGPLNFDTDAGIVQAFNLPFSAAAASTPQGYQFQLNGSTTIAVFGQENGSGFFNSIGPFVGIATATPAVLLDVFSQIATTTVRLDNGGTKGGCFIMKDSVGGTYTEMYSQGGVIFTKAAPSSTTC